MVGGDEEVGDGGEEEVEDAVDEGGEERQAEHDGGEEEQFRGPDDGREEDLPRRLRRLEGGAESVVSRLFAETARAAGEDGGRVGFALEDEGDEEDDAGLEGGGGG